MTDLATLFDAALPDQEPPRDPIDALLETADPSAYEERLKAANARGYRHALTDDQRARLENLVGDKAARSLTHKGDLLASRVLVYRARTAPQLAPTKGAVHYPHDPWESIEQADLARWLALHPMGLAWAHVPNERANARAARVLKLQGVQPGVPDVLIWTPTPCGRYRGLALELKRRTGRPSDVRDTQTAWLDRLRACGWAAAWCRGTGQAVALVEALYGKGWLP